MDLSSRAQLCCPVLWGAASQSLKNRLFPFKQEANVAPYLEILSLENYWFCAVIVTSFLELDGFINTNVMCAQAVYLFIFSAVQPGIGLMTMAGWAALSTMALWLFEEML